MTNGAFDIYLEVNHIRGGYRKGGDEARRTPVFKPRRYEDNWSIPAKFWSVDDATGECRISPPEGSKAPDFKPVDAKRLGKPIFVDQEYPAPSVCRSQLP